MIFEGGERDLLAMHLAANRSLPSGYDLLTVGEGIWDDFLKRPECQSKTDADRSSYFWDGVVDLVAEDMRRGNMEPGFALDQGELATRVMAPENRFARRILGRGLKEFLDQAAANQTRARLLQSPSGVVYVFLAQPHGYPRRDRMAELYLRCLVARGLRSEATTVVGLATEQYQKGEGFSFDVCHLHMPVWTSKRQEQMLGIQADLGYFTSPMTSRGWEDEYPQTEAD